MSEIAVLNNSAESSMAPEKKRRKFGDTPTALLKIGPSRKTFHVHKTFLTDASPFFRAALEGGFKEGSEGTMTLPDDKEETFERFLGWLYTKEYNVNDQELEEYDSSWVDIIDDHVYADRIQVEAFERAIINKALRTYTIDGARPMSLGMVRKIYEETPEISPLRRLALAMYECILPAWFQNPSARRELETMPKFTTELLMRYAGSRRKPRDYRALAASEFYQQRDSKSASKSVRFKE